MGSPADEVGHLDGETPHEVTISQDYFLGVYEVTQAQHKRVMGTNPCYLHGVPIRGLKSNHPVNRVSWEDVVTFCRRLSELPEEKAAGRVYRLPTEAEWEYACRAGSKTSYSFGDNLGKLVDHAWYKENGDRTHPVGELQPNAWGLYDMYGNVWEWCADWYGKYPTEAMANPVGPVEGSCRVSRGGSWRDGAANCMSTYRNWDAPAIAFDDGGFRVALSSSGMFQSAEQEEHK